MAAGSFTALDGMSAFLGFGSLSDVCSDPEREVEADRRLEGEQSERGLFIH